MGNGITSPLPGLILATAAEARAKALNGHGAKEVGADVALWRPRRFFTAFNRGQFAMKPLALLSSALMLSWSLSACGDDTPTRPTNIAGSYILVNANGQGLPAVVSQGANFLQEVTGGSVELRGDRTFTWRTDYRYTQSGLVTTSTSSGGGSYSLADTAITFALEPGTDRLTGTLSNGVLTMRADVELVYRK